MPDRPTSRSSRVFYGSPRVARHGPPNQQSPCASAPIDSLATSTAPASSSRSTTVASKSKHLVSIGLGAPGRRDALGGEQVLGAPGNAVQRAAIPAGARSPRRPARACSERQFLGERDHAVQLRDRTCLSRSRYILVSSVDVTFAARTSGRAPSPAGTRGRRERRANVAGACSETLIFAPGVAPGLGFLPGR